MCDKCTTRESHAFCTIKPELEAQLVERAKLRKVTKSKLVNELLEQALAPPRDEFSLTRARLSRFSIGESVAIST